MLELKHIICEQFNFYSSGGDVKIYGGIFFLSFFGNICVNENSSQMEWNMQPYMATVGVLIMLMIKSPERRGAEEMVSLIRLKLVIMIHRIK